MGKSRTYGQFSSTRLSTLIAFLFFLSIGFVLGVSSSLYMSLYIIPLIKYPFLKSPNDEFSKVLSNDGFQYFIGSNELSLLTATLFPFGKQYYYNFTSYDFYSVHDIGQSKPSSYWKNFSLDTLKQYPRAISQSGLAFVTSVMIVTGTHLKARHEHIENVLLRQGIPKSAIEYRWKWNKTNCADLNNVNYIKSKFPYTSGDHAKDVSCATVMEHIDSWYSIAERNLSFALILEDDVAFVPFLKEKFNRFMSEAAKLKLIKVGPNQNECATFEDSKNLTMDQLLKNPILTEGIFNFGSCFDAATHFRNTTGLLQVPSFISYRRYHYGRCAHMYGMTHCAAKMMINTLQKSTTRYQWADWLMNYIITESPNLIGWWPYPPLGYQIYDTHVLDKLDASLQQRTYDLLRKSAVP